MFDDYMFYLLGLIFQRIAEYLIKGLITNVHNKITLFV
jgi:hypothetical protein